jgi:hypothetical protein
MISGIETWNIYMYQYLWIIIPMFPIPYISRSWTCLDSFFSTLWITSIWNLFDKFYNFVRSCFYLNSSFSLISKFCFNGDLTSLHTIFIIIGLWGGVNWALQLLDPKLNGLLFIHFTLSPFIKGSSKHVEPNPICCNGDMVIRDRK